jgi:hypothetical protein
MPVLTLSKALAYDFLAATIAIKPFGKDHKERTSILCHLVTLG